MQQALRFKPFEDLLHKGPVPKVSDEDPDFLSRDGFPAVGPLMKVWHLEEGGCIFFQMKTPPEVVVYHHHFMPVGSEMHRGGPAR
jgi:hypothetical protein